MILYIMQLMELLLKYQLHLFFVFATVLWLVWGLKLYRARKYKPYTGYYGGTISVVVPVYHEVVERLGTCLNSVLANNPMEVILVRDRRDPESYVSLVGGKVRVLKSGIGKRSAVADGVRSAKGDIVVVVGSDSYFEDGNVLSELVKPFSDSRIGGVCGRVRGDPSQRGTAARIYRWMVELRNRLTYRAFSVSRCVHVMNGECFAVRRELFASLIDRYLNQKFMGVIPDSGDDGWITTLLLQDGHGVVYQETAKVRTFAPKSMEQLVLQQVRWARNSTRRTLYTIKRGCFGLPGIFKLHELLMVLRAPVFTLIISLSVFNVFLHFLTPMTLVHEWFDPFWTSLRFFTFFAGLFLTRFIRGSPYLLTREKNDHPFWFLPVYAIASLFIFVPIRLFALLTPKNTSWMTRNGERETGRGGTLLTRIALLVASILLVYPALFVPISEWPSMLVWLWPIFILGPVILILDAVLWIQYAASPWAVIAIVMALLPSAGLSFLLLMMFVTSFDFAEDG